ncbi:hypothetical protein ES703_54904 [subsurface metagenome]
MDEAGDCYSNWWNACNQAQSSQEAAAALIADFEAVQSGQWPTVIAAVNNNHNVLCAIRTCLEKAINWNMYESHLKGLLRRLSICWDDGPPAHWPSLGEITWKDIVKAWSDASDPGKMWLVTSVDWTRKQMWNKDPQIKWTENPCE